MTAPAREAVQNDSIKLGTRVNATPGGVFEPLLRALLIILVLLIPMLLSAAPNHPLTTIELRARAAEELMPIIRPLLGTDEGLSGRGNLLFLRADADTLAEVRQLIDQIDHPPQNLLITVRTGEDMSRENARLGVDGHVDLNGPDQVKIRAEASRRYQTAGRGSTQQLRVLEGEPAYIFIGRSIPYRFGGVGFTPYGPFFHYSLQYRDARDGFFVLPRLQGDRVTLEINPRRELPVRHGSGRIDSTVVNTTVSGALGEWIRLGGAMEMQRNRSSGILSTGWGGLERDAEVWVKVERTR